jgi:hypothetical protein
VDEAGLLYALRDTSTRATAHTPGRMRSSKTCRSIFRKTNGLSDGRLLFETDHGQQWTLGMSDTVARECADQNGLLSLLLMVSPEPPPVDDRKWICILASPRRLVVRRAVINRYWLGGTSGNRLPKLVNGA